MKNIKKLGLLLLMMGMVLGGSFTILPQSASAATGEGTATINGGTNATVEISTSNTLTVELTVGVTGIAVDADSPTFTIPAGFTAPHAAGGAVVPTNAGEVDVDGEWFAVGAGGTCAVTMGTSSATGQVITVDVTGACANTDTITLTYKGTAPATAAAAANFDVKTDDATGGGAAASITTTPAHTVTVNGTAVVANHAIASVATTDNLSGVAGVGGTDKVLGGFKITAAGEDVNVTSLRATVTLGSMLIGELTNLKIVPDDGTTNGTANDGVMSTGELATPLATVAAPVSGNNDIAVTDTVSAGSSENYFIVGTIASTVSDGDTLDTEVTGAGSVSAGATSAASITLSGTSTNSTRTVGTDSTAPTVAVTLSDSNIERDETAVVTFTFSEEPVGFSNADVTVTNGTLSVVTVDGADAKIYTSTFTPTDGTNDSTNVVTVGTGWTDAALNAPATTTDSANFAINTTTGGSGGGGGRRNNDNDDDDDDTPERQVSCPPGHLFSVSTGERCTTTSGTVSCPPGHLFHTQTGQRCTSTTGQVFCPPGQQFNTTTGQRCNAVINSGLPGASGYNFGSATLKSGSRGEAVISLQQFLNVKMNAGLQVDGRFGPKTMAAVRAYQAANGLVADGWVGPKTKAKMMMNL